MNRILTPRFALPAAIGLVTALSLASGCAKVIAPNNGAGGGGGVVVIGTGTGGRPGMGGRMGINVDSGPPDAACQTYNYQFTPQYPTVYLAVDRSGSMFHCLSNQGIHVCPTQSDTSWVKFKDAIMPVVTALQSQVRFGFATIVGTDPEHGGTCPTSDTIAPALNNADAIGTLYNSLPFPDMSTADTQGKKFETPASMVLRMLGDKLAADTAPGPKYILFTTDGESDYCDDRNALCPPDSVIYALQTMKSKGVTTIVMGIQTTAFDLPMGILQAYANAGAGEPTLPPLRNNIDTFGFFDQCNNITPGWTNDLMMKYPNAADRVRGVTLGTYTTGTAGPTKPYLPDATNATMLVTQIGNALSGVKECTFDLKDPTGQMPLQVDRTLLGGAHVDFCTALNGDSCSGPMAVPLDDTNGWKVNCVPAGAADCKPSQIELVGSACTMWRSPNLNNIHFDFPCGVVIPG